MSPIALVFLKSAFLPATAVALLCLAVGGKSDPLRARLQSLIWAIGFMIGSYVIVGGLNLPPHDVNESFSWTALLLAVFVLISPRPVGARYFVRALFVLGIGLLTLWPIHQSLNGPTQMRNLLAFFFLGLGTWSILEKATQTVQTLTLIVLPLISATALSFLLLFKGSLSMSQIVTVACVELGAMAVLNLIFPKRISMAAVLPFVSVFLILFMAAGHFYLDINPWHMIFLCWPFLLLWVRGAFAFIPRNALIETAVFGVLSIGPVAYFIWGVFQSSGPLY